MFVVFDVETTGLFPSRHHRIVEIAAIRMDRNGEVEREFVSLVNPERDIGPTSIHGLVSSDIVDAPTFSDLAGDLAELFDGAYTYVGHNVRFDADFVTSEFRRCGLEAPQLPLTCTMRLSGGGSLCTCCETHGIDAPLAAHSALDDARAAAGLFRRLLNKATFPDTIVRWPTLPKSGKSPVTRKEARERPLTNPYLMRLSELSRDDDQTLQDADLLAYSALLERVLEDRRIDADEGNALIETATRWGLSLNQVESLHSEFVRRLSSAALVDGVLTECEQRDIRQVATLLGRSQKEVDDCLFQAIARIESAQSMLRSPQQDWKGKSVCFTGELLSTIGGEQLTRTDAQALAARAGLVVASGVTKKLDILVVADPNTQSGKAKKAREYGTRIVAEPVFWNASGVQVD